MTGGVRLPLARAALALPFLIMACREEAAGGQSLGAMQVYRIGPDREWTDGSDESYLVSIDRKFLSGDRGRSPSAIRVGQVTFAVTYPDFRPLPQNRLAAPGAVILSISWEKPGSINRRWDGSWDNYYSVFNHPLEDRFGLHVRRRQDDQQNKSIILYANPPGQETLIECTETTTGGKRGCNMRYRISGNSVGEAAFSWDLLPMWQSIQDQSLKIYHFN